MAEEGFRLQTHQGIWMQTINPLSSENKMLLPAFEIFEHLLNPYTILAK
jgi:hypothetical protein